MTIQLSKEPNENKLNVFKDGGAKVTSLTPSDLGTAFSWNGDEAISFFLDVLTDCNYHSERKAIEQSLSGIKTYTEKQMDAAYDKGFIDGNQRDFN